MTKYFLKIASVFYEKIDFEHKLVRLAAGHISITLFPDTDVSVSAIHTNGGVQLVDWVQVILYLLIIDELLP